MIGLFLKTYSWDTLTNVYNFSYGHETDFFETAKFLAKKLDVKELEIEKREKGYVPFCLSNNKLSRLIRIETDYHKRLEEYVLKVI